MPTMKAIALAIGALLLAACSKPSEVAFFPNMPEGLEDCKVYNLRSDKKTKVVHQTTVIEERRPPRKAEDL